MSEITEVKAYHFDGKTYITLKEAEEEKRRKDFFSWYQTVCGNIECVMPNEMLSWLTKHRARLEKFFAEWERLENE